ncbi:MAG: nucleoside-diphosphate kinase [Flavobacteriaceae bacterium]|jgi:nucleoside-diphosphate kinase|nr:nucleoside-diphosphate kinase [Flavobacteriaceae bacterium]
MANTITLTMIKPDAVEKGFTGNILKDIADAGFTITALKLTQLTRSDAERFYSVHRERPFFNSLVEFMISGPIVAAVLKKDNAVEDFRKLIGATNPENAEEGTIRKKYAESVEKNAVHGSDSDENAAIEAHFHFADKEIYSFL